MRFGHYKKKTKQGYNTDLKNFNKQHNFKVLSELHLKPKQVLPKKLLLQVSLSNSLLIALLEVLLSIKYWYYKFFF